MITWRKYLKLMNESLSDDLHYIQSFINASTEKGDTPIRAMIDYLYEQDHLSQFITPIYEAFAKGDPKLLQEPIEKWVREFSQDPEAKVGVYYPNAFATMEVKNENPNKRSSYLTLKWIGKQNHLEFSDSLNRNGDIRNAISWINKIHDEENPDNNNWSKKGGYYGSNISNENMVDLAVLLSILGSIRKPIINKS